ncbi:hypothetical protein [Streptomyces sp. WAC 04229]|uniref:hypothetical protein n=1 Tax=Streptomyces sp. WAC 04229 TaxID=2203206 RepID=UPI003D739604
MGVRDEPAALQAEGSGRPGAGLDGAEPTEGEEQLLLGERPGAGGWVTGDGRTDGLGGSTTTVRAPCGRGPVVGELGVTVVQPVGTSSTRSKMALRPRRGRAVRRLAR